MYAQLGNIRFEGLNGFSAWERTQGATLAEMPRIGLKPRLQRTATPLDKIRLTIRLNILFCNPRANFDQLSQARLDGEVLTLVTGQGRLIGDFVIQNLSENRTELDRNGEPLDIVADVELIEHVSESPLEAAVAAAVGAGLAMAGNSPAITLAPPIIATSAGAIMNDVGAITRDGAVINADVQAGNLGQVSKRSVSVRDRIDRTLARINDAGNLFFQTRALVSSLNSSRNAVNRLKSFSDINDVNGALDANRDLQGALIQTRSSSSVLAALTATRRTS